MGTEMKHVHEYVPMPASDPDFELPLYCPGCLNSVMWADGTVMTMAEWNAYYTPTGELLDPTNDPASHNRDYE